MKRDWVNHMSHWAEHYQQLAQMLLVVFCIIGCAVWSVIRTNQLVREDAEREATKESDYRQVVDAHKAWLRSLSIAEKKTWPFTICHPASAPYGKCECGEMDRYEDKVSYVEVQPNGDVACYTTK